MKNIVQALNRIHKELFKARLAKMDNFECIREYEEIKNGHDEYMNGLIEDPNEGKELNVNDAEQIVDYLTYIQDELNSRLEHNCHSNIFKALQKCTDILNRF